MPISFLELVPKRSVATVTIESEAGPAEVELQGVMLAHLADIGRKFPSFTKVLENGASIFTAADAMPALIAAGLGHYGDQQYEQHAASLPPDVLLTLAAEIVKLTFPTRPPIALAVSEPAPGEGINGIRPEAILPPQLNS